jgi:uncharacterized protein (DUF2062 family)
MFPSTNCLWVCRRFRRALALGSCIGLFSSWVPFKHGAHVGFIRINLVLNPSQRY